jgi:uncharacterized protein (TIGR03437 family)
MRSRTLKITLFLLFCAVFIGRTYDLATVRANTNNPPARNTAAPGENNCTSCHDGSTINSGGGTLAMTGLPANYSPNQAIPLTVTVTQTGRTVFGFQVTAIDDTGKQAGTIVATDAARTVLRASTVAGNARQYIGQTSNGSNAAAANQGRWTFTWNAPATPVGRVTFYIAGLACNNDGDTPGDLTYITSQSTNPAQQCTYTIAPTTATVPATGGTGTIAVTTQAGCAYTATSNAAFITITAGASGTGSGSVSYSVAANTGAARTGTITVAGQTFTVSQAAGTTPCTYTIAPTSANVAAAGATGSFTVASQTGCAYTATSNAPFITINSGASGTGNGTVAYTVAANNGPARTGTISVAGQAFMINQAASQMQMGCNDDDYEFKGTIQSLPSTSGFIGDWMVSGRTIRVGSFTKIDSGNGQITVGAIVEIEGCVQTDGTIIAKEIEVKSGPGTNFSFTGTVEDLPATMGRVGDWKVSGVTVHVTTSTLIKQEKVMIAIGVRVEVEGVKRADGSVDAYKIEVKSDLASGGATEFRGTVENLPSTSGRIGVWSVGGRKVNVTGATSIKPDVNAVAIGVSVTVKGTAAADGSITATSIEVKSNGGGNGNFVEFIGLVEMLPGTQGQIGVWTVSGRKVAVSATTKINWEEGQVSIGSKIEVKGALLTDGSINAVKIKVKDAAGLFEFKGAIESLPIAANLIGDWRVSGRTIHVDATTVIDRKYGMAVVGASVEVHGLQQSDGSINATRIEVRQGPAGGAFMNFSAATAVSAASYLENNAPGSIVSVFGTGLSASTDTATTLPLPTILGNAQVLIDGKLARMFWASANQINLQVPADVPSGAANVVVMKQGQVVSQGSIEVSSVALSLFTANANGAGVPAGVILRVGSNGQQTYEPLARFDAGLKQFVPASINRRPGDQLFLILYGTGLKQAANTDGNAANGVAENVLVTVGGVNAQVVFAGSAPGFAGLEQINIRIPDNTPTNPNTQVVVRARDLLNNWKQANGVTIAIQ